MNVSTTTTVTVRYFAAARAAAGVDTETVEVGAGATVADLLAVVRDRHGDRLAQVLDRCSYLLDEVAVRDQGVQPADGATLDVLPPFAGG
ncbi:MoaD/ThiS family protein [Pseudonocardia bannensis]|uniref:Molybdopterin synthase sulfur carrier subunit n=1 Tax=Pseudonocardia bannensis TaxID=630973 RepID=A0A848DQI8_9PSEU|nr:MoaD/ThiS family protein [Pseudonocardia bannensis]NMH95097.1 MoaD/ThiS family protein [Pseudonocardia bannensis]